MTIERWKRIEHLFDTAADLRPAEQLVFLDRECADDLALRDEVLRLLAHDQARSNNIAAVIDGISQVPAPAEIAFAGKRLGPYRAVREIGRGGMGVVYEAVRDDDQFQKRVAVKVATRAAYSPEILQRFRHERQILAQLEHPNIARLLDGGTTDEDIPFFAMEYVEGVPIHKYTAAEGLSIPARIRLFLQVCDAVEYAHQNLVIHRDLKPSNILVAGGSVRLLDFGIAKLLDATDNTNTQSRFAPVTPDYCSPEQVRGQPVTTRSDVYSLGLVLFEVLTGERAQKADTTSAVTLDQSICETPIKPPSEFVRQLRGDLDTIVVKATQKDPARRYHSVEALADDLRRHLDSLPIKARQDSSWYRATRFARRHWMPLSASLLLFVTLVAGVVSTSYQAQRAERRFQQVRRIANALMVDIHGAIQDLPASAKAQEIVVKTAVEYLDGLAKEAKNDPELEYEIAQGYLRVASLAYSLHRHSLGRPEEARSYFEKARTILEANVRAHPDNARFGSAITLLHTRLGDFLDDNGKPGESLESLRRAVQYGEAAAARHPADIKVLDSLTDAQSTLLATHNYSAEAQAIVARHLEAAERLFQLEPVTPDSLSKLGVAYAQAGKIKDQALEREQALTYFRKNVEIQTRIVALAPENATARRNLMLAWSHIIDAALGPAGTGSFNYPGGRAINIEPAKREEALRAGAKMVEQAEWRLKRDPHDNSVRLDYAMSLGRMAVAFPYSDPKAIETLEKCLQVLRELESGAAGGTLRFVLEFRSLLAERYRQTGRFARAVSEWQAIEASANKAGLADPKEFYFQRITIPALENWATELALRKDKAGALAIARRVESFAAYVAAREASYARAPGWPPRVAAWKAELCEMLGDTPCAETARRESLALWRAVAARSDLPADLLREAKEAVSR